MAAALALAGCSTQMPADDGGFGPGLDGAGDATTAGPDDGDGSDDGADAGLDDDGADDGVDPPPPPSGASCGAIDLVFVLEAPQRPPGPNDEQLADCQAWIDDGQWQAWWDYADKYRHRYDQLRTGFSTLVSELYVTVGVPDFRVLVTGSQVPSPTWWGYDYDGDLDCTAYEPELDPCDRTLGAGRNGFEIDPALEPHAWVHEACMEGRFVEAGDPDIESTFSCLVDEYGYWDLWAEGYGGAGYSGDGPDTLMDAMGAALGASGDATCNEGFVRDEALLVVVLVEVGADPLPDSSTGDPEHWREALVQAKHGDDQRVVLLTLSPDTQTEHPLCDGPESSALSGPLRELVEMLPYGLSASSCLPSYPTFFQEAADVIASACGGAPMPEAPDPG
jgi:hypothetical protein